MFFYSVSLRWTGTYIIDPCLLSSGMYGNACTIIAPVRRAVFFASFSL